LLYIPVMLWLAFRLFRFWLRQNRHLHLALPVAAFVYVSGAIGFELVENELRSSGFNNWDLPIQIGFIFEEIAEMTGVALFLRAFLKHFSALGGGQLIVLGVRGAHEGACSDRKAQNTAISSRP
jgi:hypothetical protein